MNADNNSPYCDNNMSIDQTDSSHELLHKYFPNVPDKIISVKQDVVDIKEGISAINNIIATAKSNTDIKEGVSAASHLATTLLFNKWGRQALFVGAMYTVGGTIISTVGLGPVIATGAALYWFS